MIDLLPHTPRTFTLPAHAGKPDAPVFTLRNLSARSLIEMQGVGNPGTALWLTVVACLVSIEGVSIGGEPVKVDPQPERHLHGVKIPAGSVSEALLEQLPAQWIAELGQECTRIHTVTADDLGK